MKNYLALSASFILGAVLVLSAQVFLTRGGEAATHDTSANAPKRIRVPFMHMRNFGSGAGYEAKSGEDQIGAGSEIEIWNIDDTRPLFITEIYFTAPDGKTRLEGSKHGIPLPLELKPHTHYHFNSFYEHVKLPVPPVTKETRNFVHGYLADIRWTGPAPRVRGWDLGVKNGQYILTMPITVWEEY